MLVDLEDLYLRYGSDLQCRDVDWCNCREVKLELWALVGYNTTQFSLGRYFNGSATTIEDCLGYGLSKSDPLGFVRELETAHSCSGVCSVQPLFLFKDVRE